MLTNSRNFLLNIFLIYIFSCPVLSDSFQYNSFNNHGVVGLINTPTARFYDSSSHGITLYNGTPDQKITFTSNPYDWLEASFFYMNIQDRPYCLQSFDIACNQDYKDKGFNFKARIKEEGKFPALAIGINDIAGTGFYSSEYIVASYGLNNIDFHFGLGWGVLNGSKRSIKNPFGYLNNQFKNRPDLASVGQGGEFQPSRYFSGETVSPFFGISYALGEKILIKIENDTTTVLGEFTDGSSELIGAEYSESELSFGFDYLINKNLTVGIAHERNNYLSFRFTYKNSPNDSIKSFKYKEAKVDNSDNKYTKLIKNIENNGIGVNKILETSDSIGLELTQFAHPSIEIIEQIISSASYDAGIKKEIKTDLRIADLQAVSQFDEDLESNSKLIYQRKQKSNFNTKTNLSFRPYIAAREEFFTGALLLENNSEYIIKDNLFFTSNLKYSLADNFDDLSLPPPDTYPAQVRSDVKDYLNNFDEGIIIGRAQLDYHLTPKKNHHFMLSAGILEEMFSGIGIEYLYFKQINNYALGFELFNVRKRDYKMKFGTLDYENTIGSLNFYYRNYEIIPFDMKLSYGEYLAGDIGSTLEISRSFLNGTKFGIFTTSTNVTAQQFGEGSFDKGIFFSIPVYKNLVNYTWRPLTKDPGAKLNRKHTLHDLLVKFRSYNP